MLNEKLGKIHFWGTIVPFNGIFLPLFLLGIAGQHRRIYSYENFPDLASPEMQGPADDCATVCTVVNARVPDHLPLELLHEHPQRKEGRQEPVALQHPRVDRRVAAAARQLRRPCPTVYRGPYEYSHPRNGTEDYWPQSDLALRNQLEEV